MKAPHYRNMLFEKSYLALECNSRFFAASAVKIHLSESSWIISYWSQKEKHVIVCGSLQRDYFLRKLAVSKAVNVPVSTVEGCKTISMRDWMSRLHLFMATTFLFKYSDLTAEIKILCMLAYITLQYICHRL